MLDQRDIIKDIDKFLLNLLKDAIEKNASDIHIQAEESFAKIRYRIDGRLSDMMRIDYDKYLLIVGKIKLLSDMDISEKRLPQDKSFTLSEFRDVDFRVSAVNTVNGEKIVIRILALRQFKKNSRLLGFRDDSKDKLERALAKKSGMIIFSGPTGSGKSTSLFALLEKLNKEDVNIISIEDPVEYKIENINQISVNEKIGLTYPKILRAILRQDPDIIMIGEIRDSETAEIAIRAAITGHLVLSTLHTTDALSAITRLKDLGVDDFLIRSALNTLAGQRLVRKLCDCKIEDTMTDFEYELMKRYIRVDRDRKIYRANGCPKCKNGYLGRQAVEEVIVLDNDFKNILKDEGLESSLINEKLKEDKFRPMLVNGLIEVLEGETSFEEILSVLEY